MDQHTNKKGKIALSLIAMAAVRKLRSLPREQAAFTLYVGQEETPHRMTVISNGKGDDSTYYIYQGSSIPKDYPPMSTYLVSTQTDLDTVLAMFADNPELWAKPADDMLDLKEESYSEPR